MELDWLRGLMFIKSESGFDLSELEKMSLSRYLVLQHECIERAKSREKKAKK